MTTLVGYGSTYAEAQADLERQKSEAQMAQATGGVLVLGILAMVAMAWATLQAAFRPVAGTILFAIAAFVLWIGSFVVSGLFGLMSEGWQVAFTFFGALAMLGALVGLGFRAKLMLISIEMWESSFLYGLFEGSVGTGRVVHVLLYVYTAVASAVIGHGLIRSLAEVFMAKPEFDAAFASLGTEPYQVILASLACSAVALALRYWKHPFCSALTLTGNLKPHVGAESA